MIVVHFLVDTGNLWLNLEWSLMGISAVCIINNVVLTGLASVPTCCSGKNKDSTQQLNVYILKSKTIIMQLQNNVFNYYLV